MAANVFSRPQTQRDVARTFSQVKGSPARLSPTVTDTPEPPDTEEVTDSNPVRPTRFFENLSSGESHNWGQRPAVLSLNSSLRPAQPGHRHELAGYRRDPGHPGTRGRGLRCRIGAPARCRTRRRPHPSPTRSAMRVPPFGLISALFTDPRALCNPPGQRTAGEQPPVARVWARAPQYRLSG